MSERFLGQAVTTMLDHDFGLGEWIVRPQRCCVDRGSEVVHLAPKAMAVLTRLAASPGDVVTRQELFDSVWPRVEVSDDALTQRIAELRRALGDSPQDPRFIETIPKVGFRLIPEVRPLQEELTSSSTKGGRLTSIHQYRLAVLVAIMSLVVLLSVLVYSTRHGERISAGQAPTKSIAVLPFTDMTQTGDQEWFADGLAEEILNALTRAPDLHVSARTSSFRYKGSDLNIPEIAAELGVAHVLEGAVRSSGNRIRVTAQLIRATDGFHVWSENYDREEMDMIAIQEDLAYRIAEALETTMDPAALREMTRVGTRSVKAYQALLRGNALRSKGISEGDPELQLESLAQYEAARAIDPRFALAHRNVAAFLRSELSITSRADSLTDEAHSVIRKKLIEAIDLAIKYAPNHVDRVGYEAAKAEIEMRWQDGLRLYRTYLQARPHDFLVITKWHWMTVKAWNEPSMAEALAILRKAGARSADIALEYAALASRIGDPSEAADFVLEQLRFHPNHEGLLYQAHRALMWAGRAEEGAKIAQRFQRLHGKHTAVLARQACIEGRTADAEVLLEGLEWRFGRWYLLKLLGRDDEALSWLQEIISNAPILALADLMDYTFFDPTDFPELVEIMEREGVSRPPPVEIPFKCPRMETADVK